MYGPLYRLTVLPHARNFDKSKGHLNFTETSVSKITRSTLHYTKKEWHNHENFIVLEFWGQFHWRQNNISFVEVSTIRDAILRSSTSKRPTAKNPTNSHFRCTKHAWQASIYLSLYQEKARFPYDSEIYCLQDNSNSWYWSI